MSVVPRENVILASLPPDVFEALRPHLKTVALEQHQILFQPGDNIRRVYFPFDAVVSLVVILHTGECVEAAMAGRDGVIGASSALGSKRALSQAIVQIGGSGAVCEPELLKRLALEHPALLSAIASHEEIAFAQAQQSAACNITHDATARMCRWLLRARDLTGSDTLPLTQEFLAEMLGVRRTTISPVAHMLQAAKLIQYRRGKIQILDLEGLTEAACECYQTIRQNYSRLDPG